MFSLVDTVAAAITRGATARVLLLLSDFDGTLCEFALVPDEVRLPPARRALLARLIDRPDVVAGVVSGRRLDDLRARLDLDGRLFLAGLHGLEIEGPEARFVHPQAAAARAALGPLADAIEGALADLPGAFVERKDWSLAVHVRAARPEARPQAIDRVERLARPLLEEGTLRLVPGDCVVELLPAAAWTKGDAVRWIAATVAARVRRPLWPVYLGDDVTDEAAFAAVGSAGVTVAVGTRATGAAFRLAGPADVERLLAAVVAGLSDPASPSE